MKNFFFDEKVGYLCYTPTKQDFEKAKELMILNYRNNNLNSKTVYDRKESRLAGLLGEIAFGHLYENSEYTGKGDCPWDFVIWGRDGINVTVDVKTKYRKVPPKPNFEASVFNYQASSNHFGEVKYYVFLSTLGECEKIWFCGKIDKATLVCSPNSVLWKKGDIDPSNGKIFHEDTLSIFYKYLTPFSLQ